MRTQEPGFLGIDIGTSGVKAIMLGADGAALDEATAAYPLHTPRPGWTEQDPRDWWQAVARVTGELLQRCGQPAAVGLTGQMHGAVFLDRADEILRPALLWNDQRTAAQAAAIEDRVGAQRLRAITGNPALTGFQAPKILWLREHEPEYWKRLTRVLLPKDFIRLCLTGEVATDVSDAAGTLLLDLAARDWSPELLEALEIPRDWLPTVCEGPQVTGLISAAGAAATGLREGLPVVAGGGDNAAAAIANGALDEGQGVVSVGTSGVVFAPTARSVVDPSGALHAFCHAAPGAYHLMGVMLSAGGSLQWAASVIGGGDYDALMREAAAVPAGAEGVMFLPYLAGERTPHMDPEARGAWCGLGLSHGRGHLVRAVLEGVAYGLRDALDRVEQLGIRPVTLRLVGGGLRNPLWRGIVVASLGRSCAYAGEGGGPAAGAAILAAAGSDAFASLEEAVAAMVPAQVEPLEPDPELAAVYAGQRPRFEALYPALHSRPG